MTTTSVTVLASGLQFPEGPIAMPDGSLLFVELQRGTLSRISAEGAFSVVAELGGSPNGAAIGPDGRCYVCNNGGLTFTERDGHTYAGLATDDYEGGWIDVVDHRTGKHERLYTACGDIPLRAPNDIVFDRHGGFWFTDIGKAFKGRTERDRGAVYYARADGSMIRRAIFPLEGPNGIGLSPDEQTVYVAESHTGRVWAFQVGEPGHVVRHPHASVFWEKGHMLWAPDYYAILDSLAIDGDGNVCVADIPTGGITVISPEGQRIAQYPMPDPFTTNICFGGADRRTAYITLSSMGQIVSMPWPRAGLALNHAEAA
ncbi:SMP-30/gluconolactonase/LRE family protein [Variovorax sp. PBL-E5]|uniref:SMP-30/gluconolactonase/LRE family protein n=1 Tax=Variovorax sp. PBL-E5 TaxID=434014 RepID=UPI0013182E14|nr:SMP-30/gluconolactonase/LRE family protein [Variovorax sp. PBL-E5]VTU22975.1 Lactonase drp35 [Variovorax sp. PBL-E5]